MESSMRPPSFAPNPACEDALHGASLHASIYGIQVTSAMSEIKRVAWNTGGVAMDAEVLTITAVLVIAGWVALKIRESRQFETDPEPVPLSEGDDPDKA